MDPTSRWKLDLGLPWSMEVVDVVGWARRSLKVQGGIRGKLYKTLQELHLQRGMSVLYCVLYWWAVWPVSTRLPLPCGRIDSEAWLISCRQRDLQRGMADDCPSGRS